jgi:hypothetical protein
MKKRTGKKPSAAARLSDRWLEWEDAVNDRCHIITTLARLLSNSGREDDVVAAQVVNDTGALIEREVQRLKAAMKARPQEAAR